MKFGDKIKYHHYFIDNHLDIFRTSNIEEDITLPKKNSKGYYVNEENNHITIYLNRKDSIDFYEHILDKDYNVFKKYYKFDRNVKLIYENNILMQNKDDILKAKLNFLKNENN